MLTNAFFGLLFVLAATSIFFFVITRGALIHLRGLSRGPRSSASYRVPDLILALLGAFEFENGRAWKRYDFAIMESLHKKGYITDPRGHRETVYLTEAG